MTIELQQVGKKYNEDWIFHQVNIRLDAGQHYAFLGPNGSGKSTLLQVIAGYILPEKGKLIYSLQDLSLKAKNENIAPENVFAHLAFCAPYLQLIEEFNLPEILRFHQHFKPFVPQLSISQITELLELQHVTNKPIKYFSSGMKQRVKLGIAMLSDTPALFLDEPLTNLDAAGTKWYYQIIEKFCAKKTILIASNRPDEYPFAKQQFNMEAFKRNTASIQQ